MPVSRTRELLDLLPDAWGGQGAPLDSLAPGEGARWFRSGVNGGSNTVRSPEWSVSELVHEPASRRKSFAVNAIGFARY
ncbi:MAG TPA: hypothetical protein VLL08_01365 [Kineosporiaceae bacterium]|nr:hypothetical protein [Kineosporiaceae bacterium]